MSVRALIALLLIALCSCDIENPGDAPPLAGLYFPNALALSVEDSGTPRFLFVASSNFDLRYNSGTLHAFSLDALEDAIADCTSPEGPGLGAEACKIPARRVLADEVVIPTFSTSVAVAPDGKRVFVGTRTRDALTVVNVDPDADDPGLDAPDPVGSRLLGCGTSASRDCEQTTLDGTDATTGQALGFPKEPTDIVTGLLSDLTAADAPDVDTDGAQYVAVSHQGGAVSLFVDEPDADQPVLTSVLGGLAPVPTGIARDPVSGLFYVTRVGNGLLRIGVAVAEDEAFTLGVRLALFSAGLLSIEGATLNELRAIGFVPQSAQADATEQTGRALIVANVPSALALANLTPGPSGSGRVKRLTEIGSGGSRITVGVIGGRGVAAVSCLGSREIYVVDLDSMDVRAVIPNLSGPHGLAIDSARERLYVTDFRSSVVRIVDLSPLTQAGSTESVRIIATLGTPRVVQELQ